MSDTLTIGSLDAERGQKLRDYLGDTLAHIAAPLGRVVLYRVTSLAVDPGDPLVGIGVEAGGDR